MAYPSAYVADLLLITVTDSESGLIDLSEFGLIVWVSMRPNELVLKFLYSPDVAIDRNDAFVFFIMYIGLLVNEFGSCIPTFHGSE